MTTYDYRSRVRTAATRITYQDVKEHLEDKDSLRDFAVAVKSVAKRPGVKKFHNRAFIHSVKEIGFPRSDPREFCARLVAAQIAGLLELARADLVGAMDRKDIDASEIAYSGTTYNFIVL